MFELVHSSKPNFCLWGRVYFQGDTGNYAVVRKNDGALLTNFRLGKGNIYTFKNPLNALEFIQNLKLRGKPSLLRLLNINYQDHRGSNKKIPKDWEYKGEMKDVSCFDYAPKNDKRTKKWLKDFDWPKFEWDKCN